MSKRRPPSFIAPERMYSLQGFYDCTGITRTREREAAADGVRLEKIYVGRRAFVRGSDAIRYVEALAALTSRKMAGTGA